MDTIFQKTKSLSDFLGSYERNNSHLIKVSPH
jgi:hypothetical protein